VFQSDDRKRLAIPAIKNSKYWKAGHRRPQNVGQLGSLKSGEVPTMRVLQQLNDQFLTCPNKSEGGLRTSILDAYAITVVPTRRD